MEEIRAFVGHSFTSGDKDMFAPRDMDVVNTFLAFFDEVAKTHPHFSWVHAERAQATRIDSKVLSLSSGRNVFIGICTKKERVICDDYVPTKRWWSNFSRKPPETIWKTSDWIIQEIGLALGRDCKLILLVEAGVRAPGGLQGVMEYVEFERAQPAKAFTKILQMITDIAPTNTSVVPVGVQSGPDKEDDQAKAPQDDSWKVPQPGWNKRDYQFAYRLLMMMDDQSTADEISQGKRHGATTLTIPL